MQTTSKLLMVRPARFAFNAETAQNNFFQQQVESDTVTEEAVEEFDAFVQLLRGNDLDVTVVQDTLEPPTPDALFPNNWFSSHITGELVLYPMFAGNRRMERRPEIIDLLRRKMNHRKLVDLTHWENEGGFLEGTGSMVLDRRKRIAYCCRSPRTSERVLADFCSRMSYDAIVFDALDQVVCFAGNMLEVKSRNGTPLMVMSSSARNTLTPVQESTISTFNRIVAANLQTIEAVGGGSARCMMAEIFY